jgi:integrase/recombinase XerD
VISYVTRSEIDALLAAPDLTTRTGRRDRALLLVAMQTGLRVSELTGLRRQGLTLGAGAYQSCTGKGRNQRCTPLTTQTVAVLRD